MADLIKYLPDIYKEYYEYQKLFEAENPEFDLFYEASKKVEDNLFPKTADSKGLGFFEKLLDIVPLPTDTLEERRYRVISKLNQRLPYTEIHLRKMLAAILGWDGYTLTIKDLTAIVALTEGNNNKLKVIHELMQDVIPMNMIIELRQFLDDNTDLYIGAFTQGAETAILRPAVNEGFENALLSSGSYTISGYTVRLNPLED